MKAQSGFKVDRIKLCVLAMMSLRLRAFELFPHSFPNELILSFVLLLYRVTLPVANWMNDFKLVLIDDSEIIIDANSSGSWLSCPVSFETFGRDQFKWCFTLTSNHHYFMLGIAGFNCVTNNMHMTDSCTKGCGLYYFEGVLLSGCSQSFASVITSSDYASNHAFNYPDNIGMKFFFDWRFEEKKLSLRIEYGDSSKLPHSERTYVYKGDCDLRPVFCFGDSKVARRVKLTTDDNYL